MTKSCGATCPDGQVQTAGGCLSCSSVHFVVGKRLEDARAKISACQVNADCACVSNDTDCAGACPVAVSVEFVDAYAAELAAANKDYCSDPGLRSVCGYATPRCLPCVPLCVEGRCSSLPPVP